MAGPVRTPPVKKTVQPPRPPNAWILYRAEKSKEIGRKAQSDVSKEISAMWKAELPHVRAEYERRADLKKAEHHAMYPEYRFQPVKREEKERLREVKKQEKERRKEAQRRGRTNPQPPPPLSLPAHHYATVDPLAPYYLAERRFGPSGPSPPLSAANSPSESGTSDVPQSRVEETSVSPSANASPYPQTPSSVYASPALPPSSSFGMPFADSQSPEPDSSQSINGSEPLHWKDPQQSSLVTTGEHWFNDQEQPRTQEFLSFELPNPQMTSWTGNNSSDYADIQAILNATGDPSVFQISNFDPQSLLDHPTGQLEVSLGQMAFPSFEDPIPNLSDFPYYPQHYPGVHHFGGDLTSSSLPSLEAHPAPSHEFGGNYNADEFLNFDENVSDAVSSRPAPVEQHTSDSTSRPYAPPSGAPLSSARRVAGSWPRPIEQSPTRTSWGVHA